MLIRFEAKISGELEVPDHFVESPDLARWMQDKVELGLLPYCRPLALFDVRPPSTFRDLDLSTKHVAEEDVKWLSEPPFELITKEHEHGWRIHINRDDPDWLETLKKEGVPQSILTCLAYGLAHYCDNIDLDGDGEINDQLPQYEW